MVDMHSMYREAAELIRRLRANWTRFLAIHVAVSVLVFTILTPLATALLRLSVSLSGKAALSDQDILFFFLSPAGFLALLLLGSVFSIIIFLGHAALLVVAGSVQAGRAATVKQVLLFLTGRMAGLFQLAVLVLLRALLNLLPFVLLVLLLYQLMLSDYDINYYLAEKPPEWKWAIALGGVIAAACGANLLRLFVNWVFCLPLMLFSGRSPMQALADSQSAAREDRVVIAAWLLTWLLAGLLLTGVVSGLLTLAAMYLIPGAAASVKTLLLALGGVSLVGFLLYFAVTFTVSSWLSLLIMKLFDERGLKAELAPGTLAEATAAHPLLADRRVVGWALLAGFVAALLLTWLLVERLQFDSSTEVMAHRGASAAAPENTIAAVQIAIDSGAQWVEIDVQETADGHVAVIHDSDLKKIGGSALTVAGSTLEQLQQVDIGSWFGAEFADQRIPTLEEVLLLCKGRIGVNIELKYYGKQVRLEQRVAEIVERTGMMEQVMFMSLSYDGIQVLHGLRPEWKVGLLSSVALGRLAELDVDFLALNGRAASRTLIRQAHKMGKQVMVWTVNDPVAMASMIGRGADALITDEPELAVTVLEHFEQLEPTERLLIQLADLFDRPGLYREQ
jgi:glycerophosphoryl diester phosphodiesterase